MACKTTCFWTFLYSVIIKFICFLDATVKITQGSFLEVLRHHPGFHGRNGVLSHSKQCLIFFGPLNNLNLHIVEFMFIFRSHSQFFLYSCCIFQSNPYGHYVNKIIKMREKFYGSLTYMSLKLCIWYEYVLYLLYLSVSYHLSSHNQKYVFLNN